MIQRYIQDKCRPEGRGGDSFAFAYVEPTLFTIFTSCAYNDAERHPHIPFYIALDVADNGRRNRLRPGCLAGAGVHATDAALHALPTRLYLGFSGKTEGDAHQHRHAAATVERTAADADSFLLFFHRKPTLYIYTRFSDQCG